MTDDTQLTGNPVDEIKTEEPVVETPATEEDKTDEPVAEVPASNPTAPTNDTVTTPNIDQTGRQLYDVKCAKCGKDAQVPFKPSGDRPVYCRDCYAQQRKER
jgi:CxxC-x17-CxxC domain-containing protein